MAHIATNDPLVALLNGCRPTSERLVLGLDLDDNLVLTERVALTTAYGFYKEVADRFDLPCPGTLDEFIHRHPGKTFRTIVESESVEQGITLSDEILDHLALEERNRVLEAFAREGLQPTNGTVEVLRYLDEQGIAHPIVTSSAPDRAQVTLETAGLMDFFQGERDRIFSAQHPKFTGPPKPHPGVYNYAFSKFSPDSIFIVQEDSISGVKAAIAAGAFVIGNVSAQHSVEAQVGRMKDLLEHGAEIVVNNNRSLIALLEHLRGFSGPFSPGAIRKYLCDDGWIVGFQNRERNAGRTVWIGRSVG